MRNRIQELYEKEMLEDTGEKFPCKRFGFFGMTWTDNYVTWVEASLFLAREEITNLKKQLEKAEVKRPRSR
jgi:hypothetical protein